MRDLIRSFSDCSGTGKVQYPRTSCILIIHLVVMSLTTVTMGTRVTGHKTRAITILKGKQPNYDRVTFEVNDLQLNKILVTSFE